MPLPPTKNDISPPPPLSVMNSAVAMAHLTQRRQEQLQETSSTQDAPMLGNVTAMGPTNGPPAGGPITKTALLSIIQDVLSIIEEDLEDDDDNDNWNFQLWNDSSNHNDEDGGGNASN